MTNTTTLLSHLRVFLQWTRARIQSSRLSRVFTALREAIEGPCRLPVEVPIPVPVRRPNLALAGTLGILLMASTSGAAAYQDPWNRWVDNAANGQLVDVQVMIEGQATPLYPAPRFNDSRLYFEALQGRNYSVVVRNRTGERVGVLLTVDGLNVVDGTRTGLSNQEPMYVLDPYETATIRGWRTSLDQVRRFVFVDEQRSYAERTGQANGDMGWIRVLAFEERRPVSWLRPDQWLPRSAPAAPQSLERDQAAPRAQAAPAPTQVQGETRRAMEKSMAGALDAAPRAESYPGTGWGERREDHVEETWFVAAGPARDHLVLRYEYADGLRALGIRLDGNRLQERERGTLGFAQPPRW
jgi:hypothetical protein